MDEKHEDQTTEETEAEETEAEETEAEETEASAEDASPEEVAEAIKSAQESMSESFKAAASKVLSEKFGLPLDDSGQLDVDKINTEHIQTQAPNLIVGMLEEFTKRAKASFSTGATANVDGDVIDLDSARQQRSAPSGGAAIPSEIAEKVTNTVRDAFNDYVQENVADADAEGPVDINLDPNFLREHGRPIIASILRSVAEAIIPESINIPSFLDTKKAASDEDGEESEDGEAAEGEDASAEAEDAPQSPVNIKLNLGSFIKSLFTPRPQPAKADADAEDAEEDADDEG